MSHCLVLAVARSGFHYMADLLNGTGLFESHFIEYPPHLSKSPTFEDLLVTMPQNIKLTYIHFKKMMAGRHAIDILKELPDTKFISLHRRDIIAQAVSWYISNQTGYFVINEDSQYEDYMKKKININIDGLLHCYNEII